MNTYRLDRFLTETNACASRKLAKDAVKKGRVRVNGETVKKDDVKVSDADVVTFDGKELHLLGTVYYIYHKPQGEISATEDQRDRTVMDAFPPTVQASCFPVGRLDKDTEGLLIITNDGDLNHRLMSPKKHVDKTYYVEVSGRVSSLGIRRLETGIEFEDFTSQPARFEPISYDRESDISRVTLTISEGKFHQVKRMFHAIGNEVTYLKRIAIGELVLPSDLLIGEYREVTREWLEEEIFKDTRASLDSLELKEYEACLFDLDGTLVDSMWMWEQIDIDYLGKFGISLPHDLQEKIEGLSFHENALYFKETFHIPDSIQQIKEDWNQMALEQYQTNVKLKKGVREFLEHCLSHGIKMGIATSNSMLLVQELLKALDLTKYFTEIHTACEVAKGKPSPDIYLLVAEKLGVQAERCLVFEDVLPGLQAGHAAHMKTVLVRDAYKKHTTEQLSTEADYVIRDFTDLARCIHEG